MNIQEIKNSYQYKYSYIDIENTKETEGYIYDVNRMQYFIDDKETYFKIMIMTN